MTKTFAIVALAGATGTGGVFAGSSAAQMTVGVTVVRSCVVDVWGGGQTDPRLQLTCTAGAQSTVKVSESIPQVSAAASSHSGKILTLNF